jgi:hypothetical protein
MTKNRYTTARYALIASAMTMGLISAAHADGRAAQKLGQMGIINQQFQSKPPKSSPGYSNNATAPNANSSYNANSSANPPVTPNATTGAAGVRSIPGNGTDK